MKGLSSSQSHHHLVSYDQSEAPLGHHHHDRKLYLFSQMDMSTPLPVQFPHPAEMPYHNSHHTLQHCDSGSLIPYGTYPRRCHSTSSSHNPEVKDEVMAVVPYVGRGGGGKWSKIPARASTNLELSECQSAFPRDGYHTLQYKHMSGPTVGMGSNSNNDSPGRIRHLVHSVQKLFTKSHSLEGSHHSTSPKGGSHGNMNGGGGAGGRVLRTSRERESPTAGGHHRKHSKSHERCRSAEPKHRSHHQHHHQLHGSASAPGSGYWSSDDNLERDLCLYKPLHHHHQHPSPPSPSHSPIVMTMACHPNSNSVLQCPLPNSQSQQYFMIDHYGKINEHIHHGHSHHLNGVFKSSMKNHDGNPVVSSSNNSGIAEGTCSALLSLGPAEAPVVKKGAWSSSLMVSRTQGFDNRNIPSQPCTAGPGSVNLNLDRALVDTNGSQQQDPTCHFLQVPQDEWSTFSPMGEEDDIPCRRMRSGSYVKAMADDSCDDSGDSDGSPKLSPKMQARRASYLKATQPSLTEMTTLQISTEHSPKLQIRSHSYLRAVSEVSINRSVDTLDPKTLLNPKMLLSSPQYRSRNESYMRAMSTISQVSELEVNGQIEQVCEQVFREMQSQAVEALPIESLDSLPIPGSFRMRSHSYVRAIDQGCSRDEEEEDEGGRSLLLLPASPPRTTATTVRTIQSSTVSSCITTYKKTPPPVPPRTSTCSVTSKPYISITAQSSTESAQDAYMEEEGQPGDMMIQSRLSNSTESIDSMKALTAAIDAANAQVHGPSSQHVINSTITASNPSTTALNRAWIANNYQDEYSENVHTKKETIKSGKCLSIGIQVDGPEETQDSENPSTFTSIGVQVENDRGHRRIRRSNSVTAAVQTDLDSPDMVETYPQSSNTMVFTSSGAVSDQYSRDAASSTVSIQGSGNHYHACASDDYDDVGFDPSILPPPDPWIDSVADDPMQVVQRSVCQRDGHWFLKLLQAETDRMEGWCRQMELDQQANYLTNDMLGKVRSAVGSAKLLMTQKFQQFRKLCEENLNPNAHPKPMSSDLAGFWDMLQLSIENISLKFDELLQIRANNWRPLDPPERKEIWRPSQVQKKPPKGPQHHHPPLARDRSLESSEKQKQEARKRLMAVKRAASVRQNSATESADSIEIYIPEAQTRL
ncbi:unnamed protein product [Lota lota]